MQDLIPIAEYAAQKLVVALYLALFLGFVAVAVLGYLCWRLLRAIEKASRAVEKVTRKFPSLPDASGEEASEEQEAP